VADEDMCYGRGRQVFWPAQAKVLAGLATVLADQPRVVAGHATLTGQTTLFGRHVFGPAQAKVLAGLATLLADQQRVVAGQAPLFWPVKQHTFGRPGNILLAGQATNC